METAGFVLAGGNSKRMGQDKALLPVAGEPLLLRLLRMVEAVAGSAAVIGPRARYEHLSYPVFEDRFAGAGPLAGIHAALCATRAEWNLVLACDLPAISRDLLARFRIWSEALLRETADPPEVIVLVAPGTEHRPLCSFYNISIIKPLDQALRTGVRKVRDFLAHREVALCPIASAPELDNINTPRDWELFRQRTGTSIPLGTPFSAGEPGTASSAQRSVGAGAPWTFSDRHGKRD